MNLAFATGAIAAGLAAAVLVAVGIWAWTLASGSSAAWGVAPWLLLGAAAFVAALAYLGERVAYRRTMARRRSMGEPWAFRD